MLIKRDNLMIEFCTKVSSILKEGNIVKVLSTGLLMCMLDLKICDCCTHPRLIITIHARQYRCSTLASRAVKSQEGRQIPVMTRRPNVGVIFVDRVLCTCCQAALEFYTHIVGRVANAPRKHAHTS